MGESLNETMQAGHAVRVHPGGRVADAPDGVYVPEGAYVHEEGAEPVLEADGWELMTGYSGQHGYTGPVMHNSEYIGGGLERDIRERPGLYVALVVDHVGVGETVCHGCGAPEGEWCVDGCDADRETLTEGWVVAFREYPAWRFSPRELKDFPDLSEPDRLGWVLRVDREDLRVYLNPEYGDVRYEVRVGNEWWHQAEDDKADRQMGSKADEKPALVVRLDTEWDGGNDMPRQITLYHFTDAAEDIVSSQEWAEDCPEGAVFFSDRKDGMATGYGHQCVSVTVPLDDAWLSDEFPSGEKHYAIPPVFLTGVPIVRVDG